MLNNSRTQRTKASPQQTQERLPAKIKQNPRSSDLFSHPHTSIHIYPHSLLSSQRCKALPSSKRPFIHSFRFHTKESTYKTGLEAPKEKGKWYREASIGCYRVRRSFVAGTVSSPRSHPPISHRIRPRPPQILFAKCSLAYCSHAYHVISDFFSSDG